MSIAEDSAAPTQAAAPTGPPPPNIATIVLAVAGGFLALLDTTIVNVSLGSTAAQFGDIGQVQWVVTTYLLALCATMPASTWLARRYGPKRVYLVAVALFAAGSAACAFSPVLPALVGSRGLAGAAAGILTPVSTILLTRGLPREQLGRYQALNGSVMLIGPLLGPTVGGLLVQLAGWPAVYAINVPICAAMLVVGARRIASDSGGGGGGSRTPLHVVGLLSAAVATVSIVLAIRELADHGPGLEALLPLVVAAVAAAVFVRSSLRREHPLLDLRLFANGIYRTAALNILFLGFVLYGPMVIIPLYFEAARGQTPVVTGLLLSTAGFGVVFAGWLCRKLMAKIGGGATIVLGIALTLVGTVPFVMLTADSSYLLLCAAMVVRGIGTGLTIVPAMTRAFQSIPGRSIPDAAPQLNLLQRIGGTFAAALVTMALHREAVLAGGLVPHAFSQACVWVLVTSATALVPAFALLRAERKAISASAT